MTITRVLLLGHTGYIGSHLERTFRNHGQIDVIGRSKPAPDLTSSDAVASLAPFCDRRTALVMCAAIKKQLGDTVETFAQNLAMITHLSALLDAHPVGRLVFFSSTAVYGEDVANLGTTEQTPVSPTSFYGIGKYTAERLLGRVAAATRTPLVILRPALVYGPDEPQVFYGPSGFLRMARAGQAITLWGDGQELREFLYIDDLAAIAARLALDGCSGVVNVVSGTSYRFVDALGLVESIVGRAVAVTSKPRTKEKVDHTFDNTALRRAVPGFRFTTLEEGLKLTAALA